MPNYKYREQARVVAYCDLVFFILGFVLLLLVLPYFLDFERASKYENEVFLPMVWFFTVLFKALHLLAVCSLIWATKVSTPPGTALKLISIWRSITIIFLILQLLSVFFTFNFLPLLNLIYLVLLAGVNDFRKELESQGTENMATEESFLPEQSLSIMESETAVTVDNNDTDND